MTPTTKSIMAISGIAIIAVQLVQLDAILSAAQRVEELKETSTVLQNTVDDIKVDIKTLKAGQLYKTTQMPLSEKEFSCLARNIYYEAGVEHPKGKIAVAQITANRAASSKWGNDICSVVFAKSQFSWTLDRNKRNAQPQGPLWLESVSAAKAFSNGLRIKGLETSNYYHTEYIRAPKWTKTMTHVQSIGQHKFYSEA